MSYQKSGIPLRIFYLYAHITVISRIRGHLPPDRTQCNGALHDFKYIPGQSREIGYKTSYCFQILLQKLNFKGLIISFTVLLTR